LFQWLLILTIQSHQRGSSRFQCCSALRRDGALLKFFFKAPFRQIAELNFGLHFGCDFSF